MNSDPADDQSGFTKRSRQKKQRIIEVATTLFMRHGFRKVAVAEIAEGAGVSQVTIYKYFADKAGLVEAVLHSVLEEKSREYQQTFALEEPFMDRFERFLRLKTESAAELWGEGMEVLYKEYPGLVARLTEERRRLFVEVTAPFLDEGRAAGFVDQRVSNESILVYIDILAAGFAARLDLVGQVAKQSGLREELTRLIFFGFVRGESVSGS